MFGNWIDVSEGDADASIRDADIFQIPESGSGFRTAALSTGGQPCKIQDLDGSGIRQRMASGLLWEPVAPGTDFSVPGEPLTL
ncbi:hypothetical protein D7Y27_06805 [Corallococcus sp. AB004]|nr:hypothetical protein D7Y27_06805 [Corallococcus sp. AB004]